VEIDTSGSVVVRGRGLGEQHLLPPSTLKHTPTNTPQQGANRTPESIATIGHRNIRDPPPITGKWAMSFSTVGHYAWRIGSASSSRGGLSRDVGGVP
jgi:hypothetical protein